MPSWPFRPHEVARGEHAPARESARAPVVPDRRSRSRGQSMVEFALVLPLLFVLLLISIDFGRVYLGYINVQNMARIAANEAATNPLGWQGNDGTVTLAGTERTVNSWTNFQIEVAVPGGSATGRLMVTRDNGLASEIGGNRGADF